MASEMVKRVARALARSNGGDPDAMESFGLGPHHAAPRWVWHQRDAMAAIAEVRAVMDEALKE